MKKNVLLIILLSLGIILGVIAHMIRFVITSDIPVLYSESEAITVQVLFSLATLLLLLSTISFSSNKPRVIIGFIFLLLFIIDLIIYKSHFGAEYFNSSFAQLQVASLLSAGILVLFNFFLVFRGDSQGQAFVLIDNRAN